LSIQFEMQQSNLHNIIFVVKLVVFLFCYIYFCLFNLFLMQLMLLFWLF